MAFTAEKYRNTMSDSVYAMAVFDDGTVFMFSLFHYESTLFERWGVYMIVAAPEGETYWATADIPKSSVWFAHDSLDITSGDNIVVGNDMQYRIRWSAKDVTVDLVYDNYLPPWILGDGRDNLGDPERAFQIRSVFSPWARVHGTIVIGDEESSVDGEGMAEKTIIVNNLTRFNPELLSMRVFGVSHLDTLDRPLTPGFHIGLLDSTAHPAYGSKRIPRLFVTHNGKWLFATGTYTIEYTEFTRTSRLPYEYPKTFTLEATGDGYRLTGVYHADDLFDLTDIVTELPVWLRKLVLLFVSRPVYFRCFGTFEGTIEYPDGSTDEVYLYGPYEYVVVR